VFNVITGVYAPTQGTIVFEGRTISGLKANRIACGGITRTFQNIRLFSRLSCLDNVCVATHPHRKAGLAAALLRTPAFEKDERSLKKEAMDMLAVLAVRRPAPRALAYSRRRQLEIARARGRAAACCSTARRPLNPQEPGPDAADPGHPPPVQAHHPADRRHEGGDGHLRGDR
jgi:branched-chain amino acid transport system ATP-binding protein